MSESRRHVESVTVLNVTMRTHLPSLLLQVWVGGGGVQVAMMGEGWAASGCVAIECFYGTTLMQQQINRK